MPIYKLECVPVHTRMQIEIEASDLLEAFKKGRQLSSDQILSLIDKDNLEVDWLYSVVSIKETTNSNKE